MSTSSLTREASSSRTRVSYSVGNIRDIHSRKPSYCTDLPCRKLHLSFSFAHAGNRYPVRLWAGHVGHVKFTD